MKYSPKIVRIRQLKSAVYLASSLSILLSATPACAIDLQAVYQLAEKNDASFAANLQVFEAAKLNAPLAEAALKPSLTGTGGIERRYSQFTPDGGSGEGATSNTLQVGLSLQQKIYAVRDRLNISQAELGVEIARLNLLQQSQALVLKTSQRYFDVLSAVDKKVLAEKEKTAIGRQLDLAEQRLEVGLGTRTDLFDVNARFLLSEATLIAAENTIQDARQSLEEVIGQPLKGDLASLNEIDVVEKIQTAGKWLDEAKQSNIAIQIAQQRLASSRLDEDKANKLKSPEVSLSAGLGLSDTGADGRQSAGESESWNIGLNVRIPLYQGGSIKSQQIQAGHKRTEAELNLKQAEREMTTAVLSAYRGVGSIQRQVIALAEAVKASESALEARQEGFKAGVTTNIDVLNGQRDLFRAQNNYLSARYNTILARLQLEQASGTLDAGDISRINQRLKPQ